MSSEAARKLRRKLRFLRKQPASELIRSCVRAASSGMQHLSSDISLLVHWDAKPVLRSGRINGMQMLVRADELPGWQIYFQREYEPNETEFLLTQIRESDTCFDVGANAGFYTLLFASGASSGHVHAFEPVPLSYHMLCSSVLVNELPHVTVNQFAVSDRNGTTEFVVANDSAYSSLVDTGRQQISNQIEVSTITLDCYCERNCIDRIDILKIDVEGAEPRVLSGAERILSDSRRQPRLILIELVDSMLVKFGTNIPSILNVLRGYGYVPFVRNEGRLVEFEPRHYNKFENVIFLHSCNL